jgi:hypothetical protein
VDQGLKGRERSTSARARQPGAGQYRGPGETTLDQPKYGHISGGIPLAGHFTFQIAPEIARKAFS